VLIGIVSWFFQGNWFGLTKVLKWSE